MYNVYMFETPNSTTSETLEAQERLFFQKLKQLPQDIADKFEQEFYDLEEVTPDFFAKVDTFIKQRANALSGVMEVESGLNEEIIEEIHETERMIKQTFGDPHYFLGNGRVAEVYEFPTAPDICVKYIKDQQAYNEGNHLRVEFRFLEDLQGVVIEGVRSPDPYFIRIHPSEGHSCGMERIKGKSLSAILERPAENAQLIEMVKRLNLAEVRGKLLAYINELHKRKVTHGDLFMRNIMVDSKGDFYVIDFGKAKLEEVGEDHEDRRKRDVATLNSEIGAFFEAIDKIELS